ncbi:MAG TPA: pyrroline-5-carboxylate reductase [Solirubrobacterales bacterium]|nr:pyrroline-5-carboxylate reductase [Solirubrobacterales bacterium]HZA89261.1 pyrroline-5-carboxylate reductase [Solirubrobacterales bacterium]
MRIGFAGAGNMAAAMARGWARAEDGPGSMIFADAGSGRAAELAKELGGEAAGNVSEAAANADLFVLAVKPTALDEVSRELGGSAPPLVSVLAGVTVATIQAAFPGVPVLRAMPNLPVEVGRGVVCYVRPGDDFPPEVREDALRMLESLGTTVPVEENQIDAAGAVMSCSPAYVALVSEALARAGEREGLDSRLAHEVVVDALAGTAELLRSRDPEAIRRAVASPGGATEAGLDALAERDLEAAVQEAVEASLARMRQ